MNSFPSAQRPAFRVVALFVLMLVPALAHAGDTPLYQPAPAWAEKAPPVDTSGIDDTSPIYVRFDEQQRLDKGTVWSYSDNALRVANSQLLAQLGTIKLPWQPDAGDLVIHKVEIIRGDQHIDLLAGDRKFTVLRREEALEKLQLNGILTATMQVEGLRVGDVLHIVASTTRKDPALGGNVQTVMPLLSLPTRATFARARLSWPADLDIRWKAYRDIAAKPVVENGYKVLEIKLPLAKPDDVPADAPARFQPLPIVEATSFDSWAQVSSVMAPLYDTTGLIAPNSPLAAEVDKIKAASSDPKTRAAMALELVQEKVRYLFNGMDGGNYTPQKPSETWRLRYGDCKAKTLLLLALLHELDIDSIPVLASSQLGDLVPERLPSAAAFDHVLVRAAIGGETYWLDGTKIGDRLSNIADTPDFGSVLPVQASGATPQKIDLRFPAHPQVVNDFRLDQSAGLGFPTLFDTTITVHGPIGEVIATAWDQGDDDTKDKLIGKILSPALGGVQLTDKSVERPKDDPGTVIVRASGITDSDWTKKDDRYQNDLDNAVSQIDLVGDRSRQAWHDIPVKLKAPSGQEIRTSIKLPPEAAGTTLKGDLNFPDLLAGYRLERSASVEDGTIKVDDTILSRGGEIAAANLPDVRAKLALAKSRELTAVAPADYPDRWKIVKAGAKDGRFKPLLDAFGKVIAHDPKDKNGYIARAGMLAAIYRWQPAIDDVTSAIGIDSSAKLYGLRASLYQNIGDDQKALADMQQAMKLEPGSADIISRVASLEADTGQSDAAMKMVDDRIALGGDDKESLVQLKADLLSRQHKADAALSTLDAEIADKPGRPQLLNERCWIKGTLDVQLDSALKDCTKAIELEDQPADALDSRAMVYYRMGRLDDALADLNAALDINPGASSSLFLRGVIRQQQGKRNDAADDLAAARASRPRIDKDYARWGIKP